MSIKWIVTVSLIQRFNVQKDRWDNAENRKAQGAHPE